MTTKLEAALRGSAGASTNTAAIRLSQSHINHRVVLIDGAMLAELMMDFDLGVSVKDIYTVKRLDTDYFEED